MKKSFLCLLLVFFLLGNTLSTEAGAFGKNKIVTIGNKKWFVAETEHFEIYYYPDTEQQLDKTARMLENAYEKITKGLEYLPTEKTPFFLYATQNHFVQNNIADIGEGTGGFAEVFKNRFVIPLTGSDKWLEKVITHEFVHIVTFNILYKGWKSIRLVKFIFYPLWLMEGLAEYYSSDLDDKAYEEMIIRDAATSDLLIPLTHLHNFSHLEKSYQIKLAYKEGQYALNFLASEYGVDKIPLIVKEFRDKFEADSVFLKVIGMSFRDFDRQWRRHLKEKYLEEIKGKREPFFYGKKLTGDNEFNTNAIWSKRGENIAFISNRAGYNDLYIMSASDFKQKSVLKGRIGRSIDYLKTEGHALSFSPDGGKIAFAGKRNEKDYIYLLKIKKNKLKKIKLKNFDNISSPCFSPDGKKIVFVGMKKGVKDLYLIDTNGKNIIQLNSDQRCDDYPVFSPDGEKILYVSEKAGKDNLYSLNLSDFKINPITDSCFNERQPSWSPDGKKIIFISDKNSVYNLYTLNLNTGIAIQLSDVVGGNFTPCFSPKGEKILFVSYRKGERNIYMGETASLLYFSQIVEYPLLIQEEKEVFSPIKNHIITQRPYKLDMSTDLFYPLVFFAIPGGLYVAAYWQASDMMGNHQLSAGVDYSDYDNWLYYQVGYAYKKWRPQFYFHFRGKNDDYYYNDDLIEEECHVNRMKHSQEMVISYPFNRFNRIELGIGTTAKEERNRTKDDEIFNYTENGASFALVRDTTRWEFLDPKSGGRTKVAVYQTKRIWESDYDYTDYLFDSQRFFTVLKNKILAFRLLGESSEGKDKSLFSLPIRGCSSNEYKNSKVMAFTAEGRVNLFSAINYYMWYMFPDFYFKSLQLILFNDTGINWDEEESFKETEVEDLKNSVGVTLKLNTFIFQTFPLFFELNYTIRTDKEKESVKFYFTLSPIF
ncbi:PD40 domain-containing protein [bacterium]|nr:PD40 domain-containing protein [bacterium]